MEMVFVFFACWAIRDHDNIWTWNSIDKACTDYYTFNYEWKRKYMWCKEKYDGYVPGESQLHYVEFILFWTGKGQWD